MARRTILVRLWPWVAGLILGTAAVAIAAGPADSPSRSRTQPELQPPLVGSPAYSFAITHRIRVYNNGAIGQRGEENLAWDSASPSEYTLSDGGFLLAADSIAAPYPDGGAVWRADFVDLERFLPNSPPYGGVCGINHWDHVHLGYARVGGCPGAPLEIFGQFSASSYSDTSFSAPPGSFLSAAGVNVNQTVVGTNDPRYGDFVLYRWELHNRDGVAKGPWHAGTWIDWNVGPSAGDNDGRYSDLFNGYFIWNPVNPSLAFGMLDPDQASLYSSIDPAAHSPHRIRIISESRSHWCCEWNFCPCWRQGYDDAWSWWTVVREEPRRQYECWRACVEDKSGLLVNRPFTLDPHGSAAIHQALFAVDATSNDPAIIEANAVNVARRAARWAGFARGDVNEDGFVDLADVCWLNAGLPIYPDTYCADVNVDGIYDSADIRYLLDFVSASGPGPQGAWRFQLPPP